MPVQYKKTVAQLTGSCTVEEAEGLVEWLAANPRGRVNLRDCEHLHTAVLQVLLALRPPVSAPPADAFIARCLPTELTESAP